jgi:hypothetical protein
MRSHPRKPAEDGVAAHARAPRERDLSPAGQEAVADASLHDHPPPEHPDVVAHHAAHVDQRPERGHVAGDDAVKAGLGRRHGQVALDLPVDVHRAAGQVLVAAQDPLLHDQFLELLGLDRPGRQDRPGERQAESHAW